MLRLFARLLGLSSLAAGLASGIVDGARSIANNAAQLTPVAATLQWLMPEWFAQVGPAVGRIAHPLLWDPVLVVALRLPTVVLLFAAGTLLLVAGRPRDVVRRQAA